MYIGQTRCSLKIRIKGHISSKYESYFKRALNKYGKDNFIWDILCECSTKDELNKMETFCIIFFDTYGPNGYNLNYGGDGNSGYKQREETKNKISQSLKGHSVKPETLEKQRISMTGKRHTKETINKMKLSHSKNTGPYYEMNDEVRNKISITKKGNSPSNKKGKTNIELYGEEKALQIKLRSIESRKKSKKNDAK